MKKIIILITLVLSTIILISCGNDAKPIPITFIFDNALPEGKYPNYFKEITTPFKAELCDAEYLLKPISVARIDIKKVALETNAWYFEQMGDNTVEFSKNWLTQFYKDSLVAKHLTLPSKRIVNDNAIDSYLNKKDVLTLLFSEESDSETYKDSQVFSSAKEITSEIKDNLCNVKYKEIIVIVNPSVLKSLQPSPISPTDKSDSIKNPCNQQTVSNALDLKLDIQNQILNYNESFTTRLSNAEKIWLKYFHKNAYVALYENANESSNNVWDPGSGKNYFTNRLALLESIVSVSIFRIEFAQNGKISGLHIIECQNASELL
jgi:hypothetical protein